MAASNFGVGLPAGMALAAGAVCLAILSTSAPCKRFVALLAFGLTLHLLYWLFVSNGWARYLYIAVVLWCFLIAAPVLAGAKYRLIGTYIVVVLIAVAPGFHNIPLIAGVRDVMFKREANPNDAEWAVLRYLDEHAAAVVYAPWWAHIATVQYFSPEPARFRTGARTYLRGASEPSFVLIDFRLLALGVPGDSALVAELKHCGPSVFTARDYRVFHCPDVNY